MEQSNASVGTVPIVVSIGSPAPFLTDRCEICQNIRSRKIGGAFGSIRVVELPTNFAHTAFEKSKALAAASGGDPSKQKRALLTAIEAAANAPPNLEYYMQVLDLCRRFHVARLAPGWLGEALHAFPSSQKKLIARYPEFYSNRRR